MRLFEQTSFKQLHHVVRRFLAAHHGNAFDDRFLHARIDLAKKETDPGMKKTIVERISMMRSKEATDYMMELLK